MYVFQLRQQDRRNWGCSHYLELIKRNEAPKSSSYMKETISSKWSVRELQGQRDSLLYERLTLSANKKKY